MSQQFARDVTMDGVRGRGENFFLGLLAGIIAAIVGAALWMGVALALNMKLGLVAIAIGALVGFSVRLGGNGRGMIYGIIGAVLTLASCLSGEILTLVQMASTPQHDFYATLTTLDIVQAVTNIFTHMDPMGYLIYGIGIFEGYRFSMRQ